MKRFVWAAAILLGCAFTLSADDSKEEGWVNLIGADLGAFETTGNWTLDKDGVVTLTPRTGEKGWTRYSAYLWIKGKTYTDFEAYFDYKCQKGGNSGFYFHVGDKNDPVKKGIEVQIIDSEKKDKLTDHHSGGVIPGIPPTKYAAKPAGEWNTFHITVKNRKLRVELNGELVNEVNLDQDKFKGRPTTGMIGFQDHGLPMSLRNIRIRELK